MITFISTFMVRAARKIMIKAGIVGATGYTGSELMRILSGHAQTEVKILTSKSYTGHMFDDIFENFKKISDLECVEGNLEEMAEEVDRQDRSWAVPRYPDWGYHRRWSPVTVVFESTGRNNYLSSSSAR